MNSANGDLESKLVYNQTISSIDEKGCVRPETDRKFRKMSKIQGRIVTFLLVSLLAVGIVAATLNKSPQHAAQRSSAEESRFQQLLNAIDPTALHEVLHKNMKDKYQHGVFQEDKTAVEALHKQNAEVAESLIELAKRQATGSGNATVVTTTDTVMTSTTSTTAPSSTPAAPPPNSQSSTAAPSSQQSASPPESTAAPTAPSSTTQVASTSSPGTISGSSAPPSSSESNTVSSSPTPTSQASTSKTQSSSGSESSTKASTSSSRTTIYTTTMADGAVSTVTSVTIVPVVQADQTAGSGTATTTGNASLQTGGVGRVEIGLSAVLGGAVMVVIGAL